MQIAELDRRDLQYSVQYCLKINLAWKNMASIA